MNNITYTIEVQPEEYWLAEDEYKNMLSLADDYDDKQYAHNWIAAIRNDEYVWNWCVVIVTARYYDYDTGLELEGSDTLGCCSYPDGEDEFKAGGYYDDMCANARASLINLMHQHITLADKLKAIVAGE